VQTNHRLSPGIAICSWRSCYPQIAELIYCIVSLSRDSLVSWSRTLGTKCRKVHSVFFELIALSSKSPAQVFACSYTVLPPDMISYSDFGSLKNRRVRDLRCGIEGTSGNRAEEGNLNLSVSTCNGNKHVIKLNIITVNS